MTKIEIGLIAYGAVAALVVVVVGCVKIEKWHRLRRTVFSNLATAHESGLFAPGEYLDGMSVEDIANDLTLYAEDLSGELPSKLEPHVRAWMRQKGMPT